MATSIQRITIENDRVQLTIGDAPEPDEATTWIYVQTQVTVEEHRPLAEAVLTALQHVRTALDAEIARLRSLAGRASVQSP